MSTYLHDPDDRLDYQLDWTSRLAAGEAISTSTWSEVDGLTTEDAGISGALTKVWISGGMLGSNYRVTNTVTTNQGREMDQTLTFWMRQN